MSEKEKKDLQDGDDFLKDMKKLEGFNPAGALGEKIATKIMANVNQLTAPGGEKGGAA